MIRVKYICETNGYNMYYSESGDFFKTFLTESFNPTNPEIGTYSYGDYLYSGSREWYIADS